MVLEKMTGRVEHGPQRAGRTGRDVRVLLLEWERFNRQFNTKDVDLIGPRGWKGSIATNVAIGNETRSTNNS
jgi:hypothetical protein